jgi:hypothetical protein
VTSLASSLNRSQSFTGNLRTNFGNKPQSDIVIDVDDSVSVNLRRQDLTHSNVSTERGKIHVSQSCRDNSLVEAVRRGINS